MFWQTVKLVAYKEMLIFLRYPSWVIALLIWPFIFPFAYVFTAQALASTEGEALAVFQTHSGTGNYSAFIIIGAFLYMWINSTLWSLGGYLRQEQMRGTLESSWLSPVSRVTFLLGASLFYFLTNLIITGIMAFNFVFLMGFEFSGNFLLGLVVYALTLPNIYGLGLLFASLVIWLKEINAMVFIVRGIMMVFTGMTYPLSVLPEWMLRISHLIPATYSIDALRTIFLLEGSWVDIRSDVWFLIWSGIVMIGAGLLAFNYTERKTKKTGTLGVY